MELKIILKDVVHGKSEKLHSHLISEVNVPRTKMQVSENGGQPVKATTTVGCSGRQTHRVEERRTGAPPGEWEGLE